MVNYREILRLDSLNYTQRQIAASVHSSRNTISEVLHLADAKGLHWPLDDTVTNQEIMSLLYPQRKDAVNPRKEPDYSYIHKELAKPGVNLSLLWTEYCSKCDSEGCTPYMYSQFCDKYRHWARLTKATMRIKHKPGEAMQVDWAGTTIQYQDPVTAETYDAYIFANVKHFFALLGKMFFTSYGKEFFIYHGKQIFTSQGKHLFTRYGKQTLSSAQPCG